MKILKMKIIAIACVLVLTACSSKSPTSNGGVEYGFALDWDQVTFKNDKAKKDTLRDEQFRLNLTRVTDKRAPLNRVLQDDGNAIHEYLPDELLNGLEGFVSSAIRKNMSYSSNDADVQLGLEVDIKRFKSSIDYTWFNRYGEYNTAIEVEFLVRDKQSRILMRETVVVERSRSRGFVKGELPSAKRDKREMLSLVREALADLTLDIGWTVHSAFSQQRKYYHPLKEADDWLSDS